MQRITPIIMDLHLDPVMTYTLQTMPSGVPTVIADVPLTEAVTVTTTSSQEATTSMSIM